MRAWRRARVEKESFHRNNKKDHVAVNKAINIKWVDGKKRGDDGGGVTVRSSQCNPITPRTSPDLDISKKSEIFCHNLLFRVPMISAGSTERRMIGLPCD